VEKLRKYLKTLANGTEIQIDYLPLFNKLSGGFERKKLVVVGARPSECKSTFCLQMAYELSVKFKVLYLSLEMTVEEAMFRILCYQERRENTDFYSGQDYDYNITIDKFNKNLALKNRTLIVSEELGRSWEEVEMLMGTLIGEDSPDIIFLDYIQCIKAAGKRKETIEDYIKKFRNMAIENNFCIFLCSQINRQNISDNKEPTMEGLKDTGVLEEQADKVILLYYPCKRSPNISQDNFKIILSKNKNGMTGYHDCKITPSIYRIYEESKEL
jgi:replicative DNA helicase